MKLLPDLNNPVTSTGGIGSHLKSGSPGRLTAGVSRVTKGT
jgi:hypothetical protein